MNESEHKLRNQNIVFVTKLIDVKNTCCDK